MAHNATDILAPLYPHLHKVAQLTGPYLDQLDAVTAPILNTIFDKVGDLRHLAAPVLVPAFEYAEKFESALPRFTGTPILYVAMAAIALHVANYNITAFLEHHTRILTKIFRGLAIYLYAGYLVLSALVRDHYLMEAIESDTNSYAPEYLPNFKQLVLLSRPGAIFFGHSLIVFGILLNLWTLKALGVKHMYNGIAFGYLMDAPVTTGPYRLFNDPQYVGTTAALLGYAVKHQSLHGYILTLTMAVVFYISVKALEGPFMNDIYSKRPPVVPAKKAKKVGRTRKEL
ncbi:phospholipid methyltransferase-domain-containing protein [Phlyctochytrium arcticum]|nr:phospholipid methyltransferase-domain-containing protein [Phlyctochytrium arcticum]